MEIEINKKPGALLWDTQAGQFYVYGKTITKLVYLNPTVIKQLEEGITVEVGEEKVKLTGR